MCVCVCVYRNHLISRCQIQKITKMKNRQNQTHYFTAVEISWRPKEGNFSRVKTKRNFEVLKTFLLDTFSNTPPNLPLFLFPHFDRLYSSLVQISVSRSFPPSRSFISPQQQHFSQPRYRLLISGFLPFRSLECGRTSRWQIGQQDEYC